MIRQGYSKLKFFFFYFSLQKIVVSVVVLCVIIALFIFAFQLFFLFQDFYFNYKLDITSSGFNTLINMLLSHKELFTILFTVFGIYLVIIRIHEMSLANIIKLREEWKKELFLKLSDLEKNNSVMAEHFRRRSDEMFDFLYNVNLKIRNKTTLELYYSEFFKGSIIQFEIASIENRTLGLNYADTQIPYSLIHFRRLSKILLNPHFKYLDYLDDFENLYIEEFKNNK
jgi:hypothetical protein